MGWEIVLLLIVIATLSLGLIMLFGVATALILGKSWNVWETLIVGTAIFASLLLTILTSLLLMRWLM